MILLQLLVALCAATVLFHSMTCINRMGPQTNHYIRAAYILLSAGAFGELAALFDGHRPGIAESLFVCGLGLLNFVDRRALTRCPFLDQIEIDKPKPGEIFHGQ